MIASDIKLQYTEDGLAQVVLTTKHRQLDISKHKEVVAKGKELAVDIKQYRQKRSLNSNSYCWLLINEMANVLRSSKDEVYLTMLKRYGQSSVVSVVDKAADTFKKSVKYCEVIGEAEMQGKRFIHIKVYMGSSEYDSRQMAVLIDGIVSECKELGIETMTDQELTALKSEWGK